MAKPISYKLRKREHCQEHDVECGDEQRNPQHKQEAKKEFCSA